MELGDIEGVDIQIAAASKLAEALHRPIWLWWTSLFRASRAQLAGNFDEAERLTQETLAIGQRGQAENALHYYAQAMFNIRREQGRLAEVEGAVRGFIELYPAIPAWRAALSLLLVELGRPDEARAEFEKVAEGGFAAFPRDANWLIAITVTAEVCGALADPVHADELYTLLEPYAGRNVIVGRNATCNGSASRLLGVLASARGEYALAERHFEEAQQMHVSMGARPWHARTQVAYAEMLLRGAARATSSARRRCSPTRSWSPTRSGWSCSPSAPAGSSRRAPRPSVPRVRPDRRDEDVRQFVGRDRDDRGDRQTTAQSGASSSQTNAHGRDHRWRGHTVTTRRRMLIRVKATPRQPR